MAPASLAALRAVDGPGGRGAPATQHDAWVWISGSDARRDLGARASCSRGGRRRCRARRRAAGVHLPRQPRPHRLRRRHREPAAPARARRRARPAGQPGAGGSHVLAMRWVHDLEAFDRLPVAEQEGVDRADEGRQRRAADDVKPPTAHIARVDDRGGRRGARALPPQRPVRHRRGARPVLRRLQRRPVAATSGCSRACSDSSGDGVHDRLPEFSRAVSGALLLRAVAQRPPRESAGPRTAGQPNPRLPAAVDAGRAGRAGHQARSPSSHVPGRHEDRCARRTCRAARRRDREADLEQVVDRQHGEHAERARRGSAPRS